MVLTSSRDASDFGALVERSGARGFLPKAELSGAALAALRRRILAKSVGIRGSDLLHQTDDAAPQLRLFDARECLDERQTVARGEEVGHIIRRWRGALST